MFILPPLPYAYDALEPAISERTLKLHHDRHHRSYVETLNTLLAESGEQPRDLEEVLRGDQGKLFNNAAQAWNHAFFWQSMTGEFEEPAGDLVAAIKAQFGGLDGLKDAFVKEGAEHFASGWVWLITSESGVLKVISTHDAETPAAHGQRPLICCDLWEHAYYLDYQNDRKAFLEAWFDGLANWRFAQNQLRAATGSGDPFRYPAPEDNAQTTKRRVA